MRRQILHIVILVLLFILTAASAAPPRLVIVISLDQFRYEYLARFNTYFGAGGFRYLQENGANFTNATYKHASTSTGPGHAVILTGSYGNMNGIFSNNWYDRARKEVVYCVRDRESKVVGAPGEGSSPANLIGSTFGDELKLHQNFQSKVISLSHKDRAAILLGGKFADLALWMSDSAFVTSTYYRQDLPEWVRAFNTSGLVNSYFGKRWEKLLPESAYGMMDLDDAPYEDGSNGLGRVFPHPIRGDDSTRITSSYYGALLSSPFGNDVLAALARQAIVAEQLGERGVTDLMCLSFSCSDYVGHRFGPNSHEVFDFTLRTDRLLADLFAFIDKRIGLQNCVIVLTSDHGVSPAAGYLRAHAPQAQFIPAPRGSLKDYCEAVLSHGFGTHQSSGPWIDRIIGRNIYLNLSMLAEMSLPVDLVAAALADSLLRRPEIVAAFSSKQLLALTPRSTVELRMRNSFCPSRSGDVVYSLPPYYYGEGELSGSEHGTPYEYDAHVPLLIVGHGIRQGTFATEVGPADIAPTLSALIGVEFPAGRTGRVLAEAFAGQ